MRCVKSSPSFRSALWELHKPRSRHRRLLPLPVALCCRPQRHYHRSPGLLSVRVLPPHLSSPVVPSITVLHPVKRCSWAEGEEKQSHIHFFSFATGAPILTGTPISSASSSWTPSHHQQPKVVRDPTHERLIKKSKSRMMQAQATSTSAATTSSSQHSTPATSPAKRGGMRTGEEGVLNLVINKLSWEMEVSTEGGGDGASLSEEKSE